MTEHEDKTKSLEILVNATRSKVDYLLNADNGLDAKAGVMIPLEGAILIFYIQSFHHIHALQVIPIMILLFSGYFLWQTLKVKTYNTGVVDFYNDPKDYRSMKTETLLDQLLSDYQKAFDDNSKALEGKNKDYKQALTLFLVGILLMIFI
ncbi:MAG: hypothetical protein KBB86_00280 [Candidatus Pacebacteria bacterium]|jgi:hypothetical protein|nr:hypothetical protein [Candidatus Paceibacterota bacterium]